MDAMNGGGPGTTLEGSGGNEFAGKETGDTKKSEEEGQIIW
jgi:hypothetical protein